MINCGGIITNYNFQMRGVDKMDEKRMDRIIRMGLKVFLLVSVFFCFMKFSGSSVRAETWGDFEYSVNGDEVTITRYSGSDTELTIPKEINGKSVTSIGDNVFYNCDFLTSVLIPNSMKSISGEAFWGCSGLSSIYIPSSVNYIGKSAFGHCNGLTSIEVDVNNKVYDSRENCNAIICTETNEMICGCISTIIPEGITRIDDCAFYGCTELKSIIIPYGVTSIGEFAFSHCSELKSVTIPDSVTRIEWGAFGYCISLERITIPNSVTTMEPDVFCDCISLTNVTLSN